MSSAQLLFDAAGRRRSPAAMPGHNAGRAPRNEGMVYPADPPTVDEIVAVMRQTPADRHAHAIELAREGVPLPVIQRQLGHSYVSTTSVYLQGIDVEEIIGTIHARRAPMMHVSVGLEL
jgi:hypothetical protein